MDACKPLVVLRDRVCLERVAFCVVDLETTGLSPTRASIIEIGGVRIEGLEIRDRFETLVDPGAPVPSTITRLTGIRDGMLAGAPDADAALRGLRDWLDRTPGGCFTAHNARFDAGFVGRGFAAAGLAPLAEPVLCTRLLARRLLPELRRFGLEAVADGLGLRFRARHRALGDAEVTAQALLQLLERARRHGVETLAQLVELQAKRPPRLPRPGRLRAEGRALTLG